MIIGGDRGEFRLDLVEFLAQLGDHRRGTGPVEAGARRALLQLGCAHPFRQPAGDACERGVVVLAPACALLALDGLPAARHRVGVVAIDIGEHMRMAAHHLVADRADHVREREVAGLFGHARMEHHLQQQVAEFVPERGHVRARDRVGHLVGLLDRVGRNAGEVLREIPRAAAPGIAQPRHDVDEFTDVAFVCHCWLPGVV